MMTHRSIVPFGRASSNGSYPGGVSSAAWRLMNMSPQFLVALWVVSVLLAALGLWWVWTGLLPKRRGTTPFCRKCAYNLTGIGRERCPECGTVRSGRGVVTGERRVRRVRFVLGILCLLLGAAPPVLAGLGVLQRVNWYRYKPTVFVLADIEPNDTSLAVRALLEMERRLTTGRLSRRQKRGLAGICLRERGKSLGRVGVVPQTRPSMPAQRPRPLIVPRPTQAFIGQLPRIVNIHDKATDILALLDGGGGLTAVQRKTFFEGMHTFELKVRRQVIADKRFVVELHDTVRATRGRYRFEIETGPVYRDAALIQRGGGGLESSDVEAALTSLLDSMLLKQQQAGV